MAAFLALLLLPRPVDEPVPVASTAPAGAP
jgi:hypothetical protein